MMFTEPKRRRRQFRELEVLKMLLLRGVEVFCRHCQKPITLADIEAGNVEKEHIHEFGLDGPDEPENCCFSHKRRPCHATVTHGNGATIAGSSRHRLDKATEPERINKFQVNKPPPGEGRRSRPRTLTADRVSEPSRRCPRCGEYPDGCQCVAPPRRSGFGGGR